MSRPVICLALALLLACLFATDAWAQPYTEPTPQHQWLAQEVGVWEAKMSFLPAPGAEPVIGTGVETVEPLGPMWVTSTYEGKFGGKAFKSKSLMGYDPIKRKYVTVSCDMSNPFVNMMEGEYDAQTRILTLAAKSTDPATGKPATGKLVIKYVDDDTRVMEGYAPVPGETDKWRKMLDATFKRRK